jgi:hypothetical protein
VRVGGGARGGHQRGERVVGADDANEVDERGLRVRADLGAPVAKAGDEGIDEETVGRVGLEYDDNRRRE